MIGKTPRHSTTYYRCHPENNNRGRPDKYAGHPSTIDMHEDLIMAKVNRLFTERVFGPERHELIRSRRGCGSATTASRTNTNPC